MVVSFNYTKSQKSYVILHKVPSVDSDVSNADCTVAMHERMDGKQQGWSEAVKWTKGRRDNRAVEREAIIWIQCQDRKVSELQAEWGGAKGCDISVTTWRLCVYFSFHIYVHISICTIILSAYSLCCILPLLFWLPSLSFCLSSFPSPVRAVPLLISHTALWVFGLLF